MTSCIYYFKVLAKWLEHGNVEILIGEEYLNNGEWGSAARYFEKGISKGIKQDDVSNLSKAYLLLGKTYNSLGQYAEAEKNFRKATEKNECD